MSGPYFSVRRFWCMGSFRDFVVRFTSRPKLASGPEWLDAGFRGETEARSSRHSCGGHPSALSYISEDVYIVCTRSRRKDSRFAFLDKTALLLEILAAPQGFEPRYADPESAVLPLNEGAAGWQLARLKSRCELT